MSAPAEGAPLYLPFFQTSYGQAFGYTERTKANAQVFENRTMHPTWRGSYRLTDLTGEQIAQPLRSSYNAKVKAAQWPKPKPTYTLPPQSPAGGAARLSASNGALNASGSFSSTGGSGVGGSAGAGKSSAAPDAYPEADEFSAPAAAASSRVQIASPRQIASPPPVRPASAQRNDVKHAGGAANGFADTRRARPQSASIGGGAATAAAGAGAGAGATQSLSQAQVSGVLTARDLKRLEFYSEKFGANVSFHSTSRPQLHHHQRSVMVRNRVRPDDDPLNQHRLEAEANWDKWSISRFHRGSQGRMPGYTGYVPRIQFINGETYGRATRVALGGPRDVGRPRTPASKNGLVRGNAPGAQQPAPPTQQVDFDPLVRTA